MTAFKNQNTIQLKNLEYSKKAQIRFDRRLNDVEKKIFTIFTKLRPEDMKNILVQEKWFECVGSLFGLSGGDVENIILSVFYYKPTIAIGVDLIKKFQSLPPTQDKFCEVDIDEDDLKKVDNLINSVKKDQLECKGLSFAEKCRRIDELSLNGTYGELKYTQLLYNFSVEEQTQHTFDDRLSDLEKQVFTILTKLRPEPKYSIEWRDWVAFVAEMVQETLFFTYQTLWILPTPKGEEPGFWCAKRDGSEVFKSLTPFQDKFCEVDIDEKYIQKVNAYKEKKLAKIEEDKARWNASTEEERVIETRVKGLHVIDRQIYKCIKKLKPETLPARAWLKFISITFKHRNMQDVGNLVKNILYMGDTTYDESLNDEEKRKFYDKLSQKICDIEINKKYKQTIKEYMWNIDYWVKKEENNPLNSGDGIWNEY